jgi:hypothetical protein
MLRTSRRFGPSGRRPGRGGLAHRR